MKDTLEFIIAGMEVKRYHTVTTLVTETVGHHDYVVSDIFNLQLMTDLRIKQTAAADTATGERFCTQCAQRRPLRTGGEWVASRDGRHRRWKCGDCWVKIKEREKLK